MEWILTLITIATLALLWLMQQKHTQQNQHHTQQLQQNEQQIRQLLADKASLSQANQHLQEQLAAEKQQAEKREQRQRTDFELLATQILEKQSGKLTQTNAERLNSLLAPLRQNLNDYQRRVEEGLNSTKELQGHLKAMHQLNQQLSSEAKNLTQALKGSSKMQGDWGEMVLETILQQAGLQPNVHYTTQQTTQGLRPDVTVHLPGNRYIIIDSKVSLRAYAEYVSTQQPDQKQHWIKQHIAAIKNHIKGLNSKKYAELHGNQSPDHVFLFMPIEPAFLLAVQHDPELWMSAFQKQVVLLSPTNLMAVLRIVDEIWKQDKINQNALKIAEEAGNMYDKFVGFAQNLNDIGKHLNQSQNSYQAAMRQLNQGPGNIVKRIEKIKQLGAKANKELPNLTQSQNTSN